MCSWRSRFIVKARDYRAMYIFKLYFLVRSLTFFRRVKRVIFRHVLYIVLERGFRQDGPVLVDFVHGILEGQLCTAILLVMSEYSTWNQSRCIGQSGVMWGTLNIVSRRWRNCLMKMQSIYAGILRSCWYRFSFRTKDKCSSVGTFYQRHGTILQPSY